MQAEADRWINRQHIRQANRQEETTGFNTRGNINRHRSRCTRKTFRNIHRLTSNVWGQRADISTG